MKRKNGWIIALLTGALALCLFGCGRDNQESSSSIISESSSVEEAAPYEVEISVDGKQAAILVHSLEKGATLMEVMERAKTDGKLLFEVSGGMVVSINGKANDIDYNPCWMLYCSDKTMANTEWGTCNYEGKTLGSAILGAETLTVKAGEVYVWVYTSF